MSIDSKLLIGVKIANICEKITLNERLNNDLYKIEDMTCLLITRSKNAKNCLYYLEGDCANLNYMLHDYERV